MMDLISTAVVISLGTILYRLIIDVIHCWRNHEQQ